MNPYDTIRDTADALTEPHQHREQVPYWDASRHKKYRHHITVQPGLITQLYQSVIPTNTADDGSGSASTPSSRPPLALEALSRHLVIRGAVHRWCHSLDIKVRKSVESNIRALVGAAGNLDEDDAHVLLSEMRQWRRWAAVLTGWETVYQPAGVTCPVCEQGNTLRINLTTRTGMCRECGSSWAEDDGSIAVLADHIRVASGTPG